MVQTYSYKLRDYTFFTTDEYSGHDWCTRYGIIMGICNGLDYLHNKLEPPMYHLDLKPANVLLDENMIPKVADFGLSRLFGQEQTKITKSQIGTW
jgi:serine/threonine protein kinase